VHATPPCGSTGPRSGDRLIRTSSRAASPSTMAGRIVVDVTQSARPVGSRRHRSHGQHVYRIRNGAIRHMEIRT